MIHLHDLTLSDIGRWVVYQGSERDAPLEEGRIKRIGKEFIWVVFHCAGDWDRYDQFIAAACDPKDLEFKEPEAS